MGLEAFGQDTRRRLLAGESCLERPEAAVDEPGGVGRGDDPRETARQVQPVAEGARRA